MTKDIATESLSSAVITELRRPFTVAAIRFKPQTVTKDKSKAMATFYIDARLAAERLNHVVGPDGWTETYRPLFESNAQAHAGFHFPVECSLTVLGVQKVDVGNYQASGADEKALKSAYSDALKRSAVKFGIGAYLYAMPKVWAPVDVGENGKVRGFSKAGEQQLRAAYEKACKAIADRFGEPLHHGETDEEVGAPDPEPPIDREVNELSRQALAEAAAGSPLAPARLFKEMGDKCLAAGFDRDSLLAACATEKQQHGGYRLSFVMDLLGQAERALAASEVEA